MNKLLIGAGCALMVAGCAGEGGQRMESGPRAQMSVELEGRTAGAPVSCVSMRNLRGNRSTEDGSIIFDGPGGTLYLNRPAGGCPNLNFGRALVTRTTSTQLCRGDIARVVDTATGFDSGSCALGDFVPYSRRGG